MKTQATKRLSEVCHVTADAATDGDGFIAVHRLLTILDAELQMRPLLYEGMLAAPKTSDGKWVVVVDNSRNRFGSEAYATESAAAPLPPRIRFTIAHELGHLLQMRSPEVAESKESISEFERQADTLSPLLLVSSGELNKRLAGDRDRITIKDLLDAKKAWAISNDVLVTRLCLLHRFDPSWLRFKQSILDVAIGVGEWGDDGIARLSSWPGSFCNFSNNLVPEFLLHSKKEPRPAFAQFFDCPDFVLNGGANTEAFADGFGGTLANPRCEAMRLRLTMESAQRGRFLFIVERL